MHKEKKKMLLETLQDEKQQSSRMKPVHKH